MGLEKQIGARIPATHPLLTWLARHAAYARTARVRGTDGLTAYRRITGRTTSGPKLIGFGEKCRFKKRSHEPVTDSSTWRWNVGTWLGIDTKTGQYILWDGNNIMYARTFIRMIDSQKWCSEELAKVRATPWSVHVPIEPDVVFRKDRLDD